MGKQLLHLVIGGRVKDPKAAEFDDLGAVELVGVYPNYEKAREAWQAKAQASVDDAYMKYFVVHLHKLLEPELD